MGWGVEGRWCELVRLLEWVDAEVSGSGFITKEQDLTGAA